MKRNDTNAINARKITGVEKLCAVTSAPSTRASSASTTKNSVLIATNLSTQEANYNRHLLTHQSLKPFLCPFCSSFAAKQLGDLKRHIDSLHFKCRWFCLMDGCNNSESKAGNMNRHLKKKHNILEQFCRSHGTTSHSSNPIVIDTCSRQIAIDNLNEQRSSRSININATTNITTIHCQV